MRAGLAGAIMRKVPNGYVHIYFRPILKFA
eukprot:SAG22_NODE_1654_length_3892_cov_20.221197_3_plen_30_part_00